MGEKICISLNKYLVECHKGLCWGYLLFSLNLKEIHQPLTFLYAKVYIRYAALKAMFGFEKFSEHQL